MSFMTFINFISVGICALAFFFVWRNKPKMNEWLPPELAAKDFQKQKQVRFLALFLTAGGVLINTLVVMAFSWPILWTACVLMIGVAWAIIYRKGW